YWEVPVMVQRLCGICPVSHHLAASKALDLVVGAARVTPTADKMRRLMHYGQILQSHALHFFHLSSPDLLFGFGSELGRRNIVGVAQQYPDIAKKGILLRKFGQEVIRLTAGKRVHGTGAVPGGVNRALSADERKLLLADAYQMIAWSRDAVRIIKELHQQDRALYDHFGTVRSSFMGLVAPDGSLDLYHGVLRAKDADGRILFDQVDYQTYDRLITEEVKPWSYMKFPYFTSMGPEAGWYKVGPLARVQNCDSIPTPFAEHERRELVAYAGGKPLHGSLTFHWARMIEMLFAAETIKDLLHDDDLSGTELMTSGERRREGVGVIEAPRGTLFHHYQVGDDDLVTMANLIVSTTNNNQAMNTAVREVAKQYLHGQEITEGLLNHIEVAIRAFDPCLSCATHALGQMPLEVTLVDAEGTELDRKYKA
ncbi:MAG TPA: Ni/Fe hydrogenase subunit alpha, partial [Thauera aminoaromatica]|nr:Ni/Fe hydrogenase subunit alpha [Thauera aminoaromatica]